MTTIPTIKQLYDGALANLESEYSISVNPFGRAFLVALAGVLAGILWLFYTDLGLLQKNIWFDTADSVTKGGTLERFGVEILARWPLNATMGQYTIQVTGTVGAVIPGSAVYKADDDAESPGALFQIDGGDYTLTSPADTIVVNALKGGLSSRLAVSDTLTATAPINNVNPGAVVTSEDVVPENAETLEAYRRKIKERVQMEPGSWSAVDYRLVGADVAGVGQVYTYKTPGAPSSVDVYIQGTSPVAAPGPSASPTVITAYTDALNLVMPTDVYQANIASSTIRDIEVTVTMGTFPVFTPAQKNLIRSALEQFVHSVHPFIPAADVIDERNDIVADYNIISTITAAVPGHGFSGVAFTVDGTPSTKWEADNGEIPFLNPVLFV